MWLHLLKMVRIKRRFLIFQVSHPGNISPDSFIPGWQSPFKTMYGTFGMGHVWPTLKLLFWNPDKQIGIIRIPRSWNDKFKLFLESLTSLNSIPMTFSVFHSSGTIDQAQKWLDENNHLFE